MRPQTVRRRSLSATPLLGTPTGASSPPPLPPPNVESTLLRSRRGKILFVGLLLLLTVKLSSLLRTSDPPSALAHRDDPLDGRQQLRLTPFDELQRLEQGRGISFRTFLNSKVTLGEEGRAPYLWLTTADKRTVLSAASFLEHRVRQINLERSNEGLGGRRTTLVILCTDEGCLENCRMRQTVACYGGYQDGRPEIPVAAAWMKLSGIIDTLKSGRDVLFVDPDAVVNGDPCTVLEPAMAAVDLVAVENATNIAAGHLSSNFIWSRSMPAVSESWKEVLDLALVSPGQSVDDLLNSVLKSAEIRQRANIAEENRSNWVSDRGVRVHVLNRQQFGAYLPWNDLLPRDEEEEVPPLVSQLTCAGDLLYKDYIAKVKGYIGDADQYYSAPPKILQLPAMVGTRDDLKQLLKIAIVVAKLTDRALQSPSTATFLDVLSPSPSSGLQEPTVLPIYAAFPLPYLSHALSFSLVEPLYTTHAYSILTDPTQVHLSGTTRRLSNELKYPSEVDLRNVETIHDLVRRLSLIAYASERVVRLGYIDSPRASWREWGKGLPKATKVVQPCRKLEVGPTICGEVCRLPGSWREGMRQGLGKGEEEEDEGVLIAREMRRRAGGIESFPSLRDFLLAGEDR
ncbi:hypothetical protein JCM11251_007488 [Rhodosporidiobolus azoricus]